MKTWLKVVLGLGFAVLAIGAWVGVKSFTGSELGGPCNGDGDCKGMEAVCLIGPTNQKYCTVPCTDNASCPAQWTCGDVTVTNIDGSGNQTSGGTTRLCSMPLLPEPIPPG